MLASACDEVRIFAKERDATRRKLTTLSLDLGTRLALQSLSRKLKRPMNDLVDEALQDFVWRHGRDVRRDTQATLDSLRRYRESDPNFRKAIDRFVEAEIRDGKNDPVEGQVIIGELVNGHLVGTSAITEADLATEKLPAQRYDA